MSYTVFLSACLGFNLGFAAASALAASRWGRDPFSWLLLGALLGPISFLVLAAIHRDDLRRPRLAMNGYPGVADKEAKRVLVHVDGSGRSEIAVRYVLDHLTPGVAKVDVVTVMPMEAAEKAGAHEGVARPHIEEETERRMQSACTAFEAAGIECKSIVRFGDPAQEILELARIGNYSAIVMSRRGRGGLSKMVLGSVSERVVQTTPCPVTVVG
jgi:nucleotide-binding universal stress UspA family protein